MRTRLALKGALVVAAAVAAVLAGPGPAAAASPAPVQVRLSVTANTAKPGSLVLTAQVPPAAVQPGSTVAFFVVTKEFGPDQEVPIGTGELPKSGTVGIGYKPTWNGEEKFTVRVLSGAGATTGTGSASYEVGGAAPGPLYSVANEPRPFAGEGAVFLAALLTLVCLVWLTLLGTLVRVVTRLPGLA